MYISAIVDCATGTPGEKVQMSLSNYEDSPEEVVMNLAGDIEGKLYIARDDLMTALAALEVAAPPS